MAKMEIEEILKKYDIAAAVMLHAPGFTEMILKIETGYSCGYMENNKFKIRPPLVDPNDDTKHKAIIAETVNMLANMRIRLGQFTIAFTQAEMMVRSEFNIAPPPDKKTPPGGIIHKNNNRPN